MGRTKLKIWLLLLGWLWLQPALAQHPLEADLPDHSHHCLICALHLDGKLALTPASPPAALPVTPPLSTMPGVPVADNPEPHRYSIRAPPLPHR